jgi:hypothetical protein
VEFGNVGAPQIDNALGAERRNGVQGQDALIFIGRPRLTLGLDMLLEEIGRNGLKGPNLAGRHALGNWVSAAFD